MPFRVYWTISFFRQSPGVDIQRLLASQQHRALGNLRGPLSLCDTFEQIKRMSTGKESDIAEVKRSLAGPEKQRRDQSQRCSW